MSVDLSWTADTDDGVWFVRCQLHNTTAVPHRVRLVSTLEGVLLPPRRRGVIDPGWDAMGVTLRLEANERRGVGFACLVRDDVTTAAPVSLAEAVPVDADSPPVSPQTPAALAEEAVRQLGDHRPPRAAVVDDPSAGRSAAVDGATDDVTADPTDPTADASPSTPDPSSTAPAPAPRDGTAHPTGDMTLLQCVDAWLDAVEGRIEQARQLTDGDLETATETLSALGGAAGAATLATQVDADAAQLHRVTERASSLAARADQADVPVATLEELA